MARLLVNNIVYSFNCGQCSAQYYGETSRHLKTRIYEHRGISARTGKAFLNPSNSKIRDHALATGHDINSDCFKIIFKTNSYNLKTSESILIHKNKPSLNAMDSSIPLKIHI